MTVEDMNKFLDDIWEPKPRTVIFDTGKEGAILQHMAIFRMFANPTPEEERIFEEALRAKLKDGMYRIGGEENHIQYLGSL